MRQAVTDRRWWVLGVLAAAALALLGGLLLGRQGALAAVDDPVDVGFARDMGIHHAQAVAMSEIVHRRTEDPALATLSFDLLSGQQGQIGIMSGWLRVWGHTQSGDGAAMAWMGEPHDGPMPGMASNAQVSALNTLPLAQMDEQYLRLMIRHHVGALPMASYAAEHATSPELASLAQTMYDGQESEIGSMQDRLRERGLAAEPETTAMAGMNHG